ncbi:AAA domain-containing protein [Streptococcus agalactiae]|nr:AAA domain-containing protein [Streptococcus agalactiae]
MFHYLYTNDMRVSNLEEKATSFAKMFLTDSVPSASEDKSTNNNANTIGFYLNLINKGNSAKLAAKGDVRSVVLNFIKTFQFPNPRTKESFENAVSDGIKLAPMREIIKILFIYYQMNSGEVYLTKDEIVNFIFNNENIALQIDADRIQLIKQIEEYRTTKNLPSNIAPTSERIWKHQDRQINELLSVIEWSKFIEVKSDKVFFIVPTKDDSKYKSELLDIIMFDEFWDFNDQDNISDLKSSYFEYCDEQISVENIEFENYNDIQCNKLNRNIQNIYFGAPGTGKSYGVDKLIRNCYPDIENKDNPFVFKTTVYSDYSYYNFIGNIMPTSKNGEIGYDFKAGIFSQALATAFEYSDKEIFLIVEEMSRGNIASIFGDIFQLLDRDKNGLSEYSINNDLIIQHFDEKGINIGKKIFLPRNFHIIGTVNTSDQNVNVIDTAFKRRFEFVYVDVSPVSKDGTIMNEYVFTLANKEFEWNKLYMSLNKLITTKLELSEDKQIGQFFIKFNNYSNDEQKFAAIQNKLLHYLWDDVQGAVISDEYKIFNKDYKTFSSLYKDFGEKLNVFSEELIDLYDKQ